jgi:hypothetical protein
VNRVTFILPIQVITRLRPRNRTSLRDECRDERTTREYGVKSPTLAGTSLEAPRAYRYSNSGQELTSCLGDRRAAPALYRLQLRRPGETPVHHRAPGRRLVQ